jgi:hypothetical protein
MVKDLPLYKCLLECITSSFKTLRTFGLSKGVILNYDNLSEKLMRILIQYAVIYSVGR